MLPMPGPGGGNRADASLRFGPRGYSHIRSQDLFQTVATRHGQDFRELRRVAWPWDPRKATPPSRLNIGWVNKVMMHLANLLAQWNIAANFRTFPANQKPAISFVPNRVEGGQTDSC